MSCAGARVNEPADQLIDRKRRPVLRRMDVASLGSGRIGYSDTGPKRQYSIGSARRKKPAHFAQAGAFDRAV